MKKYLNCVMDIGELMLINGAEVHRVEDSVRRMCTALGYDRIDVFIITSSMVVTVFKGEESKTQTRRIVVSTTDLEKIHRLNDLSRKICSHSFDSAEEIKAESQSIMQQKNYPLWLECLAYALISGSFAIFFGGTLADGGVSFFIGLTARILIYFAERARMNKMFIKFISCFFATSLAIVATRLHFVSSVDKAIIGNIMTLIPGVGLTNALRDLFTGDSIASLLRFIEAILTALAIAAGYFVATFLFGGVAL